MSLPKRYPKIGDMIIAYPGCRRNGIHDSRRENFTGIVFEIAYDKWGGQRNVFINWQGETPASYDPQHGYCGTNIHNLRSTYRIFRSGKEVE